MLLRFRYVHRRADRHRIEQRFPPWTPCQTVVPAERTCVCYVLAQRVLVVADGRGCQVTQPHESLSRTEVVLLTDGARVEGCSRRFGTGRASELRDVALRAWQTPVVQVAAHWRAVVCRRWLQPYVDVVHALEEEVKPVRRDVAIQVVPAIRSVRVPRREKTHLCADDPVSDDLFTVGPAQDVAFVSHHACSETSLYSTIGGSYVSWRASFKN